MSVLRNRPREQFFHTAMRLDPQFEPDSYAGALPVEAHMQSPHEAMLYSYACTCFQKSAKLSGKPAAHMRFNQL